MADNFQHDNPLKNRKSNNNNNNANTNNYNSRNDGNFSSASGSSPAPPPPAPPRKSGDIARTSSKESRPSSMKARNSSSHGLAKVESKSDNSTANLSNINPNETSYPSSPPVSPPPSPLSPPSSPSSKENNTSRSTSTQHLTEAPPPIKDKTKPLQYALWAHYMGYGASLLCFWFGITAILWDNPHSYHCHVNGQSISPLYISVNGVCGAVYNGNFICCEPTDSSPIKGNTPVGALYILYGIFMMILENDEWGYGLWFPKDSFFFPYRISPLGMVHILIAIIGFSNYATALAGICLFFTGCVYNMATYRYESGDGGREQRKQEREKTNKSSGNSSSSCSSSCFGSFCSCLPKISSINLNPIKFFQRLYQEDKLSSFIWLSLYYFLNFALFVYTLIAWNAAAEDMRHGLIHGDLDYDCDSPECAQARQVIKSGPISRYAPWAKACGGCLNLNCALLLFPVTRLLLSKLNNLGTSYSRFQNGNTGFFTRFLAHPITRYIPLNKNIEFHKICAVTIFFFAWGHTICHCLNLSRAAVTTVWIFRALNWSGTDFVTGGVVTVAMFFIYSAAPDVVRRANFEIFFKSHHFFIIFYLFMFQHGPVFIYWTILPVVLYLIERYLQTKRGNHPFVVTKVEWIPPVMALQIRPINKEHFQFKEGQYLYLNCPAISPSEWHPFTISSAQDDLYNGPRVLLETGEEVIEAPRPADWPADEKWARYTTVSNTKKRYEKSETGYNDYISLHIKVHGLDGPKAKTWTRKLKEYFELMNPGDTPDGNGLIKGKFPFYFTRRDLRGDIMIGRQYGPDGQQIIRVDGPHSAPAEHYTSYGTVMLIGAGIGLTPCMSILTSLTKYRWKKNFTPEILHFYWVVRHSEIESFQWIVHALAELQYHLLKLRSTRQVESKYYCEINIFVTATPKEETSHLPLLRQSVVGVNSSSNIRPAFTAEELYEGMLRPTISSKGMVNYMKSNPMAPNRFQDIWVWNGRPNWDEIFKENRQNRQHSDVGVCFCGAPAIGADLKTMCDKYSSSSDDILFSLHKENF